jgi:hypothetical protein
LKKQCGEKVAETYPTESAAGPAPESSSADGEWNWNTPKAGSPRHLSFSRPLRAFARRPGTACIDSAGHKSSNSCPRWVTWFVMPAKGRLESTFHEQATHRPNFNPCT